MIDSFHQKHVFFFCSQLFEQGLQQYTWRTEESADFIETATALVCIDLHRNLDIVQTNCATIAENTLSWSNGTLDVFAARDQDTSYSIEELIAIQKYVRHSTINIPIMPLGILDFCKQKLSAPSMVPMYFILLSQYLKRIFEACLGIIPLATS